MKNRSEQLLHELGRKIVVQEYKAGDTLPKVEELCVIYGVSRSVVREAMKGLATLGLVRSNQRSGTCVLPRTAWEWWNVNILTWLLEDDKDQDFLLQLTEVRMGLEPMAAALAAKKATEEDIHKMSICFQKLEESINDVKAWAEADYEFHQRILEASYNNLIINTVKRLQKALIRSREKTLPAIMEQPEMPYDSPTTEVLERHRAVYEAILMRNEIVAQQKMGELISRVKRLLEKI